MDRARSRGSRPDEGSRMITPPRYLSAEEDAMLRAHYPNTRFVRRLSARCAADVGRRLTWVQRAGVTTFQKHGGASAAPLQQRVRRWIGQAKPRTCQAGTGATSAVKREWSKYGDTRPLPTLGCSRTQPADRSWPTKRFTARQNGKGQSSRQPRLLTVELTGPSRHYREGPVGRIVMPRRTKIF